MKLETFQFIKDKGWTTAFPKLDSPQTLILIFAAPEFEADPRPIQALALAYPQSQLIGCSSAGEIAGQSIRDNSLSVAVVKFEKTPIEIVASAIKTPEDSFRVGSELAQALSKKDLRGIFVLSDGLRVNGAELVKGLTSFASDKVIISGGLAGDGDRFKKTWAIFKGEILPEHVVALGFYGEHIRIGHGSEGGWDSFGPEWRITRSKNNILYALDEQPALNLYKEYLGERAAGLPATGLLFPFAIRRDAQDNSHLVRSILAIDDKTQSLTLAGDVPTGYLAQLMHANFDRLIVGAQEAGKLALETLPTRKEGRPLLNIAISCVGRRLLLGERTEEETESTLVLFPEGVEQVGFYSYGELSPDAQGRCDLQNQTMSLTTLSEETEVF